MSEDIGRWHITVTAEHGGWVAQCLERDIAAQGETLSTALLRLAYTIEAERAFTKQRRGGPFKGIDPAPAFVAVEMRDAAAAIARTAYKEQGTWR